MTRLTDFNELMTKKLSEEEYLSVSDFVYLSLLITEVAMLKLDHLLYSLFLVIVLNSWT